jgi:hypothetical protein
MLEESDMEAEISGLAMVVRRCEQSVRVRFRRAPDRKWDANRPVWPASSAGRRIMSAHIFSHFKIKPNENRRGRN